MPSLFVISLTRLKTRYWVMRQTFLTFLGLALVTAAHAQPAALATRGGQSIDALDHRAFHFVLPDEGYRRRLSDEERLKLELDEMLSVKEFNRAKWPLPNETALEARFREWNQERARLEAALAITDKRARERLLSDPAALEARAREIYAKTDAPVARQSLAADFQQITVDLSARTFAQNSTRIVEAIRRLDAGEDFAKVARDLSDDTSVVENEGKILNMSGASMEPNLSRLLFDTLKPGQHSGEPIVTRRGLHVIKLLQVHQPQKRPFEAVKDAIQQRILDETAKLAKDQLLASYGATPPQFNAAAIDQVIVKPDPRALELARQKSRAAATGTPPTRP